MIRVLYATLLLVASAFAQLPKQSDTDFVNKTFFPATALLYSQGDNGGMDMRCTITSKELIKGGYRFMTAAHCACKDNTDKELAVPVTTYFFITSDGEDSKEFIPAKLLGCGYQHKGDDFALFDVITKDVFPTVDLGKDPQTMDALINVASPLGLGKQVFVGSVTAASVNRPIVQGSINWTKAVLVQLPGTDGGSSGSTIVCLSQHAACAFLVGTIDDTTMVAMPVSRLATFETSLLAGTYKYWKDDTEPLSNVPSKGKK